MLAQDAIIDPGAGLLRRRGFCVTTEGAFDQSRHATFVLVLWMFLIEADARAGSVTDLIFGRAETFAAIVNHRRVVIGATWSIRDTRPLPRRQLQLVGSSPSRFGLTVLRPACHR